MQLGNPHKLPKRMSKLQEGLDDRGRSDREIAYAVKAMNASSGARLLVSELRVQV